MNIFSIFHSIFIGEMQFSIGKKQALKPDKTDSPNETAIHNC